MEQTSSNPGRWTGGRRKIDMVMRETCQQRQVTFSKRRAGVMKKASELCVMFGAQVAIIAQSPGNNVFAFGHPSTKEVIDRYLDVAGTSADGGYVPAPELETYSEALRELEEEKKKNKKKKKPPAVGDGRFLWELPIEEMGLEELEQYGRSMEEMRRRLVELVRNKQEQEQELQPPEPLPMPMPIPGPGQVPAPANSRPEDLGLLEEQILPPTANQFRNPLEIPYWF